MPTRTLALAIAALLGVVPQGVLSLQVSPNSPCASVCVDRGDLDLSDPNSSNTSPSDIVCKDGDYARSTAGVKWQNCMMCLQKSAFSQGSESDQGWFLYNLRFNFNFCVFGFPNNTKIGSNPCQTSTACGALKKALQGDNMNPKGSAEYGYCSADGGSMSGPFYPKCLSCLGGFKDEVVVVNGLVALEAGCLQKPAPGRVLGLNDTVFARTQIGIVDPSNSEANPAPAGPGGSSTPTTAIAIGVIGGVIALAAAASVTYVCIRKRRNRRARAAFNSGGGGGYGAYGGGYGHGHRPQSSLSFRCQTHLSPTSPKFFIPGDDSDESAGQDGGAPRRAITSTHRISQQQQPGGAAALWRHGAPGGMPPSLSPVAEHAAAAYHATTTTTPLSEKHGLHQLDTTVLPTVPRNAHPSPVMGRGMSPMSATPTSATQLLPSSGTGGVAPYVPTDYAVGGGRHVQQTPTSPQQQWGWGAGGAAPAPPPKGPSLSRMSFGGGRRPVKESGSPVESRAIQTSFPAPPKR